RGRSSLSSGGHPPPLAAYPGTARATPSSPYMALLQVALARFTPLARDRHCGAGLASRRRGVTPYLALWSPDFPRRLSPTRPSGLLASSSLPRALLIWTRDGEPPGPRAEPRPSARVPGRSRRARRTARTAS